MAYKCPECGEIFDEPDYETICMEEYCGVASLFGDRHYATFANCPNCGTSIDDQYDIYDEDEEDIDE